MDHVTTEQWGSLIPREHEAYAAYAFLRHYCPRNANNALDARAFLPSVALASRRRKLYHCMADIGYSTPRMHRTQRAALPKKVHVFSLIAIQTSASTSLRASVPISLPPTTHTSASSLMPSPAHRLSSTPSEHKPSPPPTRQHPRLPLLRRRGGGPVPPSTHIWSVLCYYARASEYSA